MKYFLTKRNEQWTGLGQRTLLFGLLGVSLCFFNRAFGQTDLPEVIPPSPKVQSFHRYGDIPVSHSTGVPDISIPLYTINSGGLQVPIVLRYHPGAVKPPNDHSNIAFGWTLEYGGNASRNINDDPDVEYPQEIRSSASLDLLNFGPQLAENADYLLDALLNSTAAADIDTERDVFSYRSPTSSGKFIVSELVNGDFMGTELSQNGDSIIVETEPWGTSLKKIKNIKVLDRSGTQFYFGNGNQETVSSWGGAPSSLFNGVAATSWMIDSIVSPSDRTLLSYDYADVEFRERTYFTDYFAIKDDYVEEFPLRYRLDSISSSYEPCDGTIYVGINTPIGHTAGSGIELTPGIDIPNYDFGENPRALAYDSKTISSIDFLGGRIVFGLSTDNRTVESLSIYDGDNNLYRKINFEISTFSGALGYRRLDGISITSSDGTTVEQNYNFSYNESHTLGTGYNVDYWGFFSGNSRNGWRFKPSRDLTQVRFNCPLNGQNIFEIAPNGWNEVSRNSSASYGKLFLLDEIEYPTGGSTLFEYEQNEFMDIENGLTQGAGMRIKSITK
ncbi:MAG: hypothetical protein AAGA86_15285, partial [Bacteroidota bacterium]